MSGLVVLEHERDNPAGFVADWLDAREITWTVARPEDPEPDLTAATAIVSLGSTHSAYASEPEWIVRELGLLRAALAADTPVLGICFGAQALALAAGGVVSRAARPEVGWVDPESALDELRGPWLSWHFDAITAAPAGAELLARSPDALQAFRLGRNLGVQFHPEVTPAIWEGWSDSEPEIAERHAGDLEAFAANLAARAGELRTRVFALLDCWHRSLRA